MDAYLIDNGILVTEEYGEFQCYNKVYNKAFGFYDENQYYETSKMVAIANARKYAEDGVDNTYAIVSATKLPDDFDFRSGCVEDESYEMENVVYSVAKIGGKIVEGFLEQDKDALTHIINQSYAREKAEQDKPRLAIREKLKEYIVGCLESNEDVVKLGYHKNEAFIDSVVSRYQDNLGFVGLAENYSETNAKDDAINEELELWTGKEEERD